MFTTIEKPKAKSLVPVETFDLTRYHPTDEYRKVAQKIGFNVPKVDTRLLDIESFLFSNNWPVYNLSEVIKYMTRVSNRDNPKRTGWGWTPLREKDCASYTFLGSRDCLKRAGDKYPRRTAIDWLNRDLYNTSYRLPVPLTALQKVAKLEEAGFTSGNGFKYVVSDYEVAVRTVPKPDPFLMVYLGLPKDQREETIPRSQRWVIDFWDEPGFGLTEQLK
jgi:hypothetical protein